VSFKLPGLGLGREAPISGLKDDEKEERHFDIKKKERALNRVETLLKRRKKGLTHRTNVTPPMAIVTISRKKKKKGKEKRKTLAYGVKCEGEACLLERNPRFLVHRGESGELSWKSPATLNARVENKVEGVHQKELPRLPRKVKKKPN